MKQFFSCGDFAKWEIFTAMDIGSGITDWDDGMMSLGKQTAVGAVTQGIGSKYDKFKSDSFLASTAAAGVKTGSLNLAGTAINSRTVAKLRP